MPKIVDHDRYRRELLEKCFHLFSRKGYSQVTMRQIAKEIGVSTGTLYHYFPTKESILEHLFSHVQETNVGEYLRRVDDIYPQQDRVDIIAEFWRENEAYYQNVMLLALDLFRQKEPGYETCAKVFADFSDYYTRAMADRLEVSEPFARSLFVYLLGLVFHTLLTPGHMSYEQQIQVLRNALKLLMAEAHAPSPAGKKRFREFLDGFVARRPSTPAGRKAPAAAGAKRDQAAEGTI